MGGYPERYLFPKGRLKTAASKPLCTIPMMLFMFMLVLEKLF